MTLLDAILLGFFVCVLLLGARLLALRAYVRVNPRYRPLLQRHGLISPRALLSLPAVIISGHPDRNVSRVTLGTGPDAVIAFLKREHRVRWKQQLMNFLSGFGPVSLSHREAATLDSLWRAGIGCSAWIAVGADGQGRAFLLVEELTGCVDLRRFLANSTASSQVRRRSARQLGETLARIHDAGFAHRDLYAKHILVHPDDRSLHFLDWQRSVQRHCLTTRERWHDLASLDATLGDELAGPRERLSCLRAYCISANLDRKSRRNAVAAIRKQCRLLAGRRHIREARHLPETPLRQELIWLDGEALCVTPDYYQEWNGALPSTDQAAPGRNQVQREWVSLPRGGSAVFARRRMDCFFAWLAKWFGAKPLVAPEVQQAGLLYRLQRYGLRTARLLAFGQRQARPWRIESFLLTEAPAGARSLLSELGRHRFPSPKRKEVFKETGATLRRLHSAGCYLRDDAPVEADFLAVHESEEPTSRTPTLAITLARIDCVRLHRRPSQHLAARDLAALCRWVGTRHFSRSDKMRFLRTYLGTHRLTPDAKSFVRLIESQLQKEVRA
jgi:tRNA A-37 threonylcarbamoyl transferase component Bud32